MPFCSAEVVPCVRILFVLTVSAMLSFLELFALSHIITCI